MMFLTEYAGPVSIIGCWERLEGHVMFLTEYAKPVQLLGVDDRIKQMLGREPCDASNCVVSSTHFLGLKFRTRTQSTI